MKRFSSAIKRKMGAVFLSVAVVVVSAATAHATAVGFANINALLLYKAEGLVSSSFSPGFGKGGWDGNFTKTVERKNGEAFATTDFDPLGIFLGPIETPNALTLGPVGGMLLSASALSLADSPGFAAAIAGSLGTLKFRNLNPFGEAKINFTLLVNATIAGGSFGPTSIGNEEEAFAGVALAGFTKGFRGENSKIFRSAFDTAPPDFLKTTFKKHKFGIIKKHFTKVLRPGGRGRITLGVGAASAAKATPEPGTIILLGTGLLGVGVWKLRKKNSKAS